MKKECNKKKNKNRKRDKNCKIEMKEIEKGIDDIVDT